MLKTKNNHRNTGGKAKTFIEIMLKTKNNHRNTGVKRKHL